MQNQLIEGLKHTHQFYEPNRQNERRTLWVIILTVITMVIEITAGMVFNSMALQADGWHMATHAGALGISMFAYYFARKNNANGRFSFGSGKVATLGGFTSSVLLLVVALFMVVESLERLFNPLQIRFNEALLVAVIGLVVNMASVWLLHGGATHTHTHNHNAAGDCEPHEHRDHNLMAAYLHVLADAVTSIAAIAALLVGKYLGWYQMDALMGIVGAVVITVWAVGLLRTTGYILLDRQVDGSLAAEVRRRLEGANTVITDLHIWSISQDKFAAEIALATASDKSAADYKAALCDVGRLVHVTVEVHQVQEDDFALK